MQAIAKVEGRHLHALMEEAFKGLVEKKKRRGQMRPAVCAALERTLSERDWLYRQLAK